MLQALTIKRIKLFGVKFPENLSLEELDRRLLKLVGKLNILLTFAGERLNLFGFTCPQNLSYEKKS